MQIIFAIPPISHFRRWLGESFSLFQSYEISIALSINSLRNYWAFPDIPYLVFLQLDFDNTDCKWLDKRNLSTYTC